MKILKTLSHVLEHKQIKHSDVNKHFKEIVIKNNAEGLIVRNDSAVYKIKKKETADLLITGYTLGKYTQSNKINFSWCFFK